MSSIYGLGCHLATIDDHFASDTGIIAATYGCTSAAVCRFDDATMHVKAAHIGVFIATNASSVIILSVYKDISKCWCTSFYCRRACVIIFLKEPSCALFGVAVDVEFVVPFQFHVNTFE